MKVNVREAVNLAPYHQAPGPRGVFVLGNVPEVRKKGQLQFYVDAWREYGDVARLQMGPLVMHLLTHPDHVQYILVKNRDNYPKGQGYNKLRLALGQGVFTSEGDVWQRQRRMLQPSFTPRAVLQFGRDVTAATEILLKRWEQHAATGATINVHEEMMHLAMNIIGRAMFGMDVSDRAAAAADAFGYVLQFVGERSISIVDVPLFIPTSANRRFQDAMQTLDAFMSETIAEHRQKTETQQDLLSFFLAARDDATGEAMSDQQLRDEVLTIFFAGHETTARR